MHIAPWDLHPSARLVQGRFQQQGVVPLLARLSASSQAAWQLSAEPTIARAVREPACGYAAGLVDHCCGWPCEIARGGACLAFPT